MLGYTRGASYSGVRARGTSGMMLDWTVFHAGLDISLPYPV